MKKILFLSFLGLPVLFLGGCSPINNNDSEINTGDSENISQLEQQISGSLEQFSGGQTGNETLKTNKNISYYNSERGFGLEFPLEWSGYIEEPDMGGVDFSLDNRQMFYIHAKTIDEYNKYGAPESIPTPIFLGKNEKYIFYYAIHPIGYSDWDKPSDETKKRIAEIESIIKTFFMQ